MSLADYILIFLIGVGVFAAVSSLHKHRKDGTCIGCNGSCLACDKKKKKK